MDEKIQNAYKEGQRDERIKRLLYSIGEKLSATQCIASNLKCENLKQDNSMANLDNFLRYLDLATSCCEWLQTYNIKGKQNPKPR